MALTKLGRYIELLDLRNSDNTYAADAVVGLSTQKTTIKTKANLSGVSLTSYKLFPPKSFAYVPDTSRRGDKVSLAYNNSNETYLVSSISVVFKVADIQFLLPDYLYMYFNRPEFDHYARFNSWGSARETFSWEEMRDIDIDLPSITVQQKYVDIYNSMLANQRCYERGLEDLKLTIDSLLERFKKETKRIPLGELIIESDERNKDDAIQSVNGVNKDKLFMPSVANGADLTKYKLVRKNQFSCNLMHVGRDVAIPVALNSHDEPIIVSPAYIVFNVKNDSIIPEFLLMWLSRTETDRYAWFMCDTNVRSGMEKKRFFEIDIPVPSIQEQRAIIEIYDALYIRREVNERLKAQIKDLCPILVKGAVEKGEKL